MIRITYNCKNYEVKVKGHANCAPKGEDPICAGISTLTMTLSCALKQAKEQGIITDLDVEMTDGKTHIKAVPKEGYEENVRTIFTTIFNGYDAFSLDFPEYVSFKSMA